MADSTVAALTASDALTGPELFYADGFASAVAADVKVTATQIKAWATSGLTITATTGTFTLTNAKTFSVTGTLTLAGTDGSTLNIGTGGTLGTAALKATGTSGNTVPLLDGNNTWSGTNAFEAGTITTSQPFTITQTVNNGAVNFTSFLVNTTYTAHGGTSKLFDLQNAGVSKFYVYYDGTTYATGALYASGSLVTSGGNVVISTTSLGVAWAASTNITAPADGFIRIIPNSGATEVIIGVDAANTLALRNGTAAQEHRWYSNYVSATDYHRGTFKSAKTTLSGVTGASVTATNLIPDGAIPIGVTTKVTTGLGVSGGTSGYQVGDGTDPDRWGAITGTAAGTSSDNRDWTATTIQAFTAANNLVITAVGGNFDGTGVIDICVQYFIGECD